MNIRISWGATVRMPVCFTLIAMIESFFNIYIFFTFVAFNWSDAFTFIWVWSHSDHHMCLWTLLLFNLERRELWFSSLILLQVGVRRRQFIGNITIHRMSLKYGWALNHLLWTTEAWIGILSLIWIISCRWWRWCSNLLYNNLLLSNSFVRLLIYLSFLIIYPWFLSSYHHFCVILFVSAIIEFILNFSICNSIKWNPRD